LLIIVVVQVGAVKIYVAAVRRSGKGKERMKLSLPPKLVEKLVWVPVISFCRIFIPTYKFDALLCRNWPFLPLNSLTLWITLISDLFLGGEYFGKEYSIANFLFFWGKKISIKGKHLFENDLKNWHNCLQYERVCLIFLFSYFEYC
jgi:hypothetical protein